MWDPAQYELLDFGDGRKLERFGGVLLDRPSPAAETAVRTRPELWLAADACYHRVSGERGSWQINRALPASWHAKHGLLHFELKLTDAGQVGLFPEQSPNWLWIADQVRGKADVPKVLNLFAYTGGSSLAAAAAGAEVVHVDAARASVAAARHNADLSGLTDRPIRWIVEDVRKFVQREIKRGSCYHGVILDPPTYGHGPSGQAWKLAEHLPALLADCGRLLAEAGGFLLLTCHAPGIGPRELEMLVRDAAQIQLAHVARGELDLISAAGRRLPSGVFARCKRSGGLASPERS